MQLTEFYGTILPPEGQYILFQDKSHTFHATLDELAAATEQRIDTQGLYFATAAFGPDKNRKGSNVRALRSHRIDIDAGVEKFAKHPDDTYPTQQEAIAALVGAIKTGLPAPTLIVSSGEGLHAYWALDQDVTPDEWLPVAKSLNAAGKALGLKIDAGCTADTARVLRPIGTPHKNGKRVALLMHTRLTHDHTLLGQQLAAMAPEPEAFAPPARATRAPSINDDILAITSPPASLARVAEHCTAVAEMRDKQGNVPEPQWRAVIGIAKYCDDGEAVVHDWSAGYAGYDPRETQDKLERWETPPTTCQYFSTLHPGCGSCKYKGKVTTPKQLGYVATYVSPGLPPIPDAEDTDATLVLPDDVDDTPDDATPERPVAGRADLFDESEPFFYRESNARWVLTARVKVHTKDATGQTVTTEVLKPVCHKLIWVESNSVPGASDTNGVLIQFGRVQKAGATRQDRFEMPGGVSAAPDTLARFMADQGVNLDPANRDAHTHLQQFVRREIIRKQNDMRFVLKDRFGYHFHEGKFICSMGPYTVYPDGTIEKTTVHKNLIGVAKAMSVGCLPPRANQRWENDAGWPEVAKATIDYIKFLRANYSYEGYEVARLALAVSLASPLLVFTADAPFNDADELPAIGFVVSMYSTSSGLGKSSLQEVVAAAYGKPELKRSGKKTAMTNVAASTLAKSMAIYPFILDEVTQNDASQAAELVDTFANGSGRVRAQSDGAVTKSASTWALISLLSTNVPQRELIAQSQKRSSALQMRLMELNFDGLKPSGAQREFSAGLKQVSINCGAFGLYLARRVVSLGHAEVTAMAQNNLHRAYHLLGVPQEFRFFARGLSAMLTMNQLLGKYAPFDEKELVATFRTAVEATNWFIKGHSSSPRGLLAEMLNSMSPHIMVTKTFSLQGTGGSDAMLNTPLQPLKGREVLEWNAVMVDSKAVALWCAENQTSTKHFLDSLDAVGMIVRGPDNQFKKQRRLTTGISTMAGASGTYYTFRTRPPAAGAVSGDNVVELRRPEDPGPALDADASPAG